LNWEELALKQVDKVWGRELWLVNNELYCSKILEVRYHEGGSYHEHVVKDETFLILEGSIMLIMGTQGGAWSQVVRLDEGMSIRLRPGVPHLVVGLSEQPARILETSTQHDDTDVVRHWRLM